MKEVDPKQTDRAVSYELFINAPMPMVTIFKTIDVTRIIKESRKGYKFNMLFCYCIGCAANCVHEFKLLPIGKKMFSYDNIGVSVIVANKKGKINSCDLPFDLDINEFNKNYLNLTGQVYETCEDYEIKDRMMIGTSALPRYDFDGIINMYSGIFNNPFLIWGRYEVKNSKYSMKLSFQFHHVQMDGDQACMFLDELQNKVNNLMLSYKK